MNIVFRTDASLQIGTGHVMRCLTLADELCERGAEIKFVCREHPGNLIGLIEGKGYTVLRLPQPAGSADAMCYPAPFCKDGSGGNAVELAAEVGRNKPAPSGVSGKPADRMPEMVAERPYSSLQPILNSTSKELAHAAWLGVPWQQDATETLAALGETQPAWLIVDHYALDSRWEQTLRPSVGKIMVIDDLADRPHDCDLLLDQNLYQDMAVRYDSLVPATCAKLLGPKYALLRPEFAQARKTLRQRDGQVRRILVFFGGVDPTNETEKAIHALASIADRQFTVDVVVGGGNPHQQQIEKLCAMHEGFHYHCQVDNMAELMAAADLAIGAGGTATWERCAVGLNAVVTVLAANQQELAEMAARSGLCFYFSNPRIQTISSDNLLPIIRVCLDFPETLRHYSENCLKTVDALGIHRVVNILFPQQIIIRRATIEDCDSVLEWRNSGETRRYAFENKVIPLGIHREWYKKSLESSNRIILIGEIDNIQVGVLRYDFMDKDAQISIFLVPGFQGRGIGVQLIKTGTLWIQENYPNIKRIKAEILINNMQSINAFLSAGFKELNETLVCYVNSNA